MQNQQSHTFKACSIFGLCCLAHSRPPVCVCDMRVHAREIGHPAGTREIWACLMCHESFGQHTTFVRSPCSGQTSLGLSCGVADGMQWCQRHLSCACLLSGNPLSYSLSWPRPLHESGMSNNLLEAHACAFMGLRYICRWRALVHGIQPVCRGQLHGLDSMATTTGQSRTRRCTRLGRRARTATWLPQRWT